MPGQLHQGKVSAIYLFYKRSSSDTNQTSLSHLLSLFSINISAVAETELLLAPWKDLSAQYIASEAPVLEDKKPLRALELVCRLSRGTNTVLGFVLTFT